MRRRLAALAAGAVPVVGLVASWGLGAVDGDSSTASVASTSPAVRSATTSPSTAAPATPAAPPVTTTHTVSVGGVKREWLQTVPAAGATAATRILVVLHGRAVTPQQEAQRDGFLPLVAPDNLELVYPTGVGASWNAGGCCGQAAQSGVDDIAFLRALVTAIDPQHAHTVTLVGYSNGGRMAYAVACQSPSIVEGFAIVGALPLPSCTVAHPVTLLQLAGTADDVVPFVAPAPATNVTAQVAALRGLDNTAPTPATWESGALIMSTWTSSSTQTRIGLAAYQGGTHAWPSGGAATPSAAEVILRFFSTGNAHGSSRAT
jgi:polyhydroxybutyrate depolymerase